MLSMTPAPRAASAGELGRASFVVFQGVGVFRVVVGVMGLVIQEDQPTG